MITVKDAESKITVAKRNITVKNVKIEDGIFVDEDGEIVEAIADKLPAGITEFTIKITVEIPDEDLLDEE